MKFDPAEYKKKADENFEASWLSGEEILGVKDINKRYPRLLYRYGKPHPIFETINNLRMAYLRMGFEEVVNPVIVEEEEVKRQFGHESLAVLDRCFYLAGLPRPNIGISKEEITKIEEIIGRNLEEKEIEAMKESFHAYKKGRIEGDDLISVLSERLSIDDLCGTKIIGEVFPEFKELSPIATKKTLRSHMTSGWFITLGEMLNKRELPMQLFSVDKCFRREQREDATRLQCYNSASCVIMDEDVGVDDGKAISESLLAQFGFEDFRFRLDEKRSKYYIPGTQTEVFAYHPALLGSNTKYSDGWVEIATFGVYSPTALAQYNIPYPVMNLGLGVERLAIIIYNSKDIRELVYPQFYREELSDGEISRGLYLKETPKTDQGLKLANSIKEACARYGTEKSPCKFFVWRGEIYGRRIEVNIVEPEENTKLCGPAYINKIIVKDGNILAVPADERFSELMEGGTDTGITFLDAFSQLAASRIENLLTLDSFGAEECGVKECKIRVRAVKTPGDINIGVKEHVQRYIMGKKKKIDVRGPVFTTIEMVVME